MIGELFMRKLESSLVELIDKIAELARTSIMDGEKDNNLLFSKVQQKGVDLFAMKDDEFDGVSMWNKEEHKPEIYLDMNQSEERRLFTLAHELGHLFLDLGWSPFQSLAGEEPKEKVISINYNRDKDKKDDTLDFSERAANEFAGAFLMPKTDVEDVISETMNADEKVSEVSRRFNVTKRAARNRLIVLGEINE